MATIQSYGKMTTGAKYFDEQIKYHEDQFIQEARLKFPQYAHLDDSQLLQNKEVNEALKDNPYAPKWQGTLATDFGVENQIVNYEAWQKFCGGYTPNSDLLNKPTKLNNNAFDIDVVMDENGNPQAKFVEKEGKRIGTEIIFANSKEFAVLCAGTNGEQHNELINLKNNAIAKVMEAMQDDIYVRKMKDGVKTKEKGTGLIYVAYNHTENRGATQEHDSNEQKQTGLAEPFDHTHLILGNVTKDKDGNLCSLDNDLILQNKAHYNAIYTMYMTEGLRELGYELKPKYVKDQMENEYMVDTEKGLLTMVPAVPQELVDHFSQRSKQIKNEGGDSVKARVIAQASNKNEKTEETNSEMKARWQQEMLAISPTYGEDYFKGLQNKEVADLKREPLENLTKQENWKDKLVDSFYDHHKEIAGNEGQIKSYLAIKINQYADKDTANRIAEEIFNERFVAVLDRKCELDIAKLTDKPEDMTLLEAENLQINLKLNLRFIDSKRIQEEKAMVESFYQRSQENKFVLDKNFVDGVIAKIEEEQGYKMNSQQREAVINQTTKEGAFASLSGRAGSGKSTSSKATVSAYEQAGFKVIGVGTSNKNTKGLLAETGIKQGYNTEKLLKLILNDKLQLDEKTILVCDEMAMADGYTWTRLVSEINKAGAGAKFLGESEQLKNVGASGGFELFRSTNLNNSKLTIINRQKLEWQKEATEQFASGKGDEALKKYHDEGKINTTAKSLDEANKNAVDDYFKAPEYQLDEKGNVVLDKKGQPKMATKLIITDTNENASTINDKVKEKLKAEGKITEDLATIKTKKLGDRGMAEGDKVIFKEGLKFFDDGTIKNNKGVQKKKEAFEITNGEEATVKSIDTKKQTMTLLMADGNERTIRTNQKFDITHSYAITVHSSQGASIDYVKFVPTNASDLSKMYVACSRQKQDMGIYLNDELKSKVEKKLANLAPTEKMMELAKKTAKDKNIEIDPYMYDSFMATREFLNEHCHIIEGKNTKHPMDDYHDFLVASTKEQTKKTTMDYQTIDDSVLKFVKGEVDTKAVEKQKAIIETPEEIKARMDETKLKAILQQRDGGVANINDVNRQIPSIEVKQTKPEQYYDEVMAQLQIANQPKQKQQGLSM